MDTILGLQWYLVNFAYKKGIYIYIYIICVKSPVKGLNEKDDHKRNNNMHLYNILYILLITYSVSKCPPTNSDQLNSCITRPFA